MLTIIKKYICIAFLAMIPICEMRGAIILAYGFGLPFIPSYIICVIYNMLPVPFIFIFARKVLTWGCNKKYIGKFFKFCLYKGRKCGDKLVANGHKFGIYIALILFVGIPLPGTGAWTGTLAASILNLDFKKSLISIMFGILLAGIIIMLLSYGVFNYLDNGDISKYIFR